MWNIIKLFITGNFKQGDIIVYSILISLVVFTSSGFFIASHRVKELKNENKQLQTQLKQCQETNQQLTNQIQLQQEEYNKAQKILQEAYNKPAKRVYIRQVVKEPVYITNEDCQKIGDLIDQAQEQLK